MEMSSRLLKMINSYGPGIWGYFGRKFEVYKATFMAGSSTLQKTPTHRSLLFLCTSHLCSYKHRLGMNLQILSLLTQVLWIGTTLAQDASDSTTSTSALASSTVDTIQPMTITSTLTSSTAGTTQPTTSICPGNLPSDRSVWCGHNIKTDYEVDYPDTGVTREYTFNVENSTISPLGLNQTAVTINGQFPGPTIYADWGDWVAVTVINSLSSGMKVPPAVSIHWHGIRQLNTTQFDGVPSVTQCPIAPGQNMTYRWRATQYGTAWYHSHVGLQAWEGVFGGIVINGPATKNYDVDLGVLLLNDWDRKSVYDLYADTQRLGPVPLDTGLLNGTNEFNTTADDGTVLKTTGARFQLVVNPGTSYRLRLVNAAVDSMFKFFIENHPLTVIAMDLVPIHPVVKKNVSITMGALFGP